MGEPSQAPGIFLGLAGQLVFRLLHGEPEGARSPDDPAIGIDPTLHLDPPVDLHDSPGRNGVVVSRRPIAPCPDRARHCREQEGYRVPLPGHRQYRVEREEGSNTGKRIVAPTSSPSPTATRMGRTAAKMGGWESRWVMICFDPAASNSTWRSVSPSTDPEAEYRPTSESREKEKVLHDQGRGEVHLGP